MKRVTAKGSVSFLVLESNSSPQQNRIMNIVIFVQEVTLFNMTKHYDFNIMHDEY